MESRPASPARLVCFALLHALPIAAPAIAQQERLETLVDRAIAELGEPAKCEAAIRRLDAFGPRIVPQLRELLHWSKASATTPAQRLQVLYVLGGKGRAAIDALPELRDILRHTDEDLGRQVLWTLARIAPFLDRERCDAVRADLAVAPRAVRGDVRAGVLDVLLQLGAEPREGMLVQYLQLAQNTECIAACQWIVARADDLAADRERLKTEVRQQLERLLRRLPVTFVHETPAGAADLAEAWLALTKQPLDDLTARGLLVHWRAHERRRGVAWLHENGAALPPAERGDVVVRLWDGDPQIVRAASEALAAWGSAGLVGLVALRRHERTHGDPELGKACGRAAAAVLAATADMPAADQAFLAAIDAALRDRPVVPRTAPPTPAGIAHASTMLRLAMWEGAEPLARALAQFEAAWDDSTAEAISGWLMLADAEVAGVGLAWLARHPGAARRSIEQSSSGSLSDKSVRVARWGPEAARGAAIEATAWWQTVGVARDDLLPMLDSRNPRLIVRALGELVLRAPEALKGCEPRLSALAAWPAKHPLFLDLDADGKAPWMPLDKRGFDFDLEAPVRAIAALALAARGVTVEDAHGLAAIVRAFSPVALPELPRWVDAQRTAGTLAAVVDAIERDCRQRLGVAEALGWPKVATGN